jgi:hypothetical protein
MRILTFATIGALAFLAVPSADAAKWCRDGASGTRCGYASLKQCQRSGGDCYRAGRVAARDAAPRYGMRGQTQPNRPYWSSPYTCFFDDGGGRFRPCDQPSGGGFN